jgi:hypothetical protein
MASAHRFLKVSRDSKMLGTLGTSFSHQRFKLFKKFGTNLEQLGTTGVSENLFQVVPSLFQAPKLHQSIANIRLFQLFQLFHAKRVRGGVCAGEVVFAAGHWKGGVADD